LITKFSDILEYFYALDTFIELDVLECDWLLSLAELEVNNMPFAVLSSVEASLFSGSESLVVT